MHVYVVAIMAMSLSADPAPTEQQKLAPVGFFDVATCFPQKPTVPLPVSTEALTGALLAAGPSVMECLVDPKHRGPAKKTKVVVDSTFDAGKVTNKLSGDNLTPDGIACIQKAFDDWTTGVGVAEPEPAPAPAPEPEKPAKGKGKGKAAKVEPPAPPPPPAPVTAHREFEHSVDTDPSAVFGVNPASDVAQLIRQSESGWCDCFAPWKSSLPRAFRAHVKLQAKVAPQVTFDPSGDASADGVAACLKGKIAALTFAPPKGDWLEVPVPLRYVHSDVPGTIANDSPEVQFAQLDRQRGRLNVQAAIAIGSRNLAAAHFDDQVKQYKAQAKGITMATLSRDCGKLVKFDQAKTDAFKALLEAENQTHAFTVEQKAKNPAWSNAEVASQGSVANAQKFLDESQKILANDQGICAKVK
jgi:hypothetical protein